MIKDFLYKKADGEVSKRLIFVLNSPSDSYFGIDLSEFDQQDQNNYRLMLESMMDSVKEEIEKMGLEHNYRRFKEDRIID